jgi:hypothetical protein
MTCATLAADNPPPTKRRTVVANEVNDRNG